MNLYPQLPRQVSVRLVGELSTTSVADLEALAKTSHPACEFTPTGGAHVSEAELQALRIELVAIARACGYPNPPSQDEAARFDSAASIVIFERMKMVAVEASNAGVWEFLACVLVPDLVRWRFFRESASTTQSRFFAGRRNVFQRLWWRAFHLAHGAQPTNGGVSELLRKMGEDELVQLTERPRLAGVSGLSSIVATELLKAAGRHSSVTRRELMREGQKRLLRVSSFVALESLNAQDIADLASSIFDEVAAASVRASQGAP